MGLIEKERFFYKGERMESAKVIFFDRKKFYGFARIVHICARQNNNLAARNIIPFGGADTK